MQLTNSLSVSALLLVLIICGCKKDAPKSGCPDQCPHGPGTGGICLWLSDKNYAFYMKQRPGNSNVLVFVTNGTDTLDSFITTYSTNVPDCVSSGAARFTLQKGYTYTAHAVSDRIFWKKEIQIQCDANDNCEAILIPD